MIRVLFLQRTAEEWLGPMYISAMLKARGHSCDILIEPMEGEDFAGKALEASPDLIAFSCLACDFPWAVRLAGEIKKRRNVPVIVGGTHATLEPEDVLSRDEIDMVCVGEGEYPMAELADALERGGDYSGIPNLWIKKDGRRIRNGIRDLIADLDALPFPDRSLYMKYPFFKNRGKRPIHLGRGCPYECSYCHNAGKKRLFEGKGTYVRWRSRENILAEIREIESRSFVKILHFIDDSFGINERWLVEFIEKLATTTRTRLAIQANMRADMVTETLCLALERYGTGQLRLRIAVETGDPEFRKTVLKKSLTNEALFRAAGLFRKHRIRFITYNMVGLPGETLEQAFETLRLNMALKPDLAICFIFQPYPGTELSDYAIERGYLAPDDLRKLGSEEYAGFYHSHSPLKQDDIGPIENLQKIFSLTARHPSLYPLFRKMVRRRKFAPVLSLAYKFYLKILLQRRFRKDRY